MIASLPALPPLASNDPFAGLTSDASPLSTLENFPQSQPTNDSQAKAPAGGDSIAHIVEIVLGLATPSSDSIARITAIVLGFTLISGGLLLFRPVQQVVARAAKAAVAA